MQLATVYWTPKSNHLEHSAMAHFAKKHQFKTYEALYAWSVERPFDFWKSWYEESGLITYKNYRSVFAPPRSGGKFIGAKWFSGLEVNFAENLLSNLCETPLKTLREDGGDRTYSKSELITAVASLARVLKEAGFKKGDRAAACLPNCAEAVIAMLAVSSLGGIWSSCSPDFGLQGMLDRFEQIKPAAFFGCDGYRYGSKDFDVTAKLADLKTKLQTDLKISFELNYLYKDKYNNQVGSFFEALKKYPSEKLSFEKMAFADPVYIMFSSGTTGAPKCIVHSIGGTLLQHYKELKLHCDLRKNEKILYFTTLGWMMWNWVVSSIACGAQLLCFDGSPAEPNLEGFWNRLRDEKINVFGTSAKFLASCRAAGLKISDLHKTDLRLVLSTGSPLLPEDFEYFYQYLDPRKKIQLASISGGTDILSCFMLGTPMKAVLPGEIQCRGLGMDIAAVNEKGETVVNEEGELVCRKPFPSQPLCFWNDEGDKKYRSAYFEKFEGLWHHGDYVKISTEGGVVVYGRSDATLNPGGVRIGTAEFYRQLADIKEVADSLVTGLMQNGDEKVVLFVKLQKLGSLNDELKKLVSDKLRSGASPRHVPAYIFEVSEIPYTLSGKKVELAVKDILNGREPKNLNALINPACLEEYRKIAKNA